MEKLIITLAPTGNVPTKALNQYTPVTNDEIVEDLIRCQAAGVSVAHLHVRDNNQMPTSERALFKDLLDKIDNSALNVITQVSTGARGGMNTIEYRSQMLDLNVEMASLSTGSSNFPTAVNGNSPALIDALGQKMIDHNIKPEIEVFDLAMLSNTNYLVKKGVLKTPLHFNFVMNVPGSIKGTPKNLMFLVDNLPVNSTFSVSGIGKSQVQMLTLSILLGGHVRTGLEDVITINGKPCSNLELVEQIVTIAKAIGREIATPDEARKILSLA